MNAKTIGIIVLVIVIVGAGWWYFLRGGDDVGVRNNEGVGDTGRKNALSDLYGGGSGSGGGFTKLCESPLSSSELAQVLPTSLSGYEKTTSPNIPSSQERTMAFVTFTKYISDEEPDREVSIAVSDQCIDQSISWSAIYRSGDNFAVKTEATTVSGNQAIKTVWRDDNRYDYKVLVGNRAYVIVNGNAGTPEADVRSAANAVDYAKLKEFIAR